jgi:hypothetical protein
MLDQSEKDRAGSIPVATLTIGRIRDGMPFGAINDQV